MEWEVGSRHLGWVAVCALMDRGSDFYELTPLSPSCVTESGGPRLRL